MDIAIMVEGQMGLNWTRWQRMVRSVEESGFAGLYRSDHYVNPQPPDQDSLELWVSLTWLAGHTVAIDFGPLVTPVSFRHPSMTARMAAAVDDLSGGRLVLGLGAGWQEREHEMFGWDLLDLDERFLRLREGIRVVKLLMESDEPASFAGNYYTLKDAILLPRPKRPGGPPILIGGNGPQYTLPLAAEFANEWNAVYLPPAKLRQRMETLDQLLVERGRRPEDVRRSMMTGVVFAKDPAELERKIHRRTGGKRTVEQLRKQGVIAGVAEEMVEQLKELEATGLQRVMLQWLDLDDVESLLSMAKAILPHFQ